MSTIQWKTFDTGEIVGSIRESRRYLIYQPSSIFGVKLSMQAPGQECLVRVYVGEVAINTLLTISGTTPVLLTIDGRLPTKDELLFISIETISLQPGEVLLSDGADNLLISILSGPVPPQGTRAVPSDVVGCSLEVNSSGLWEGECGYVGDYTAFAALVAANVAKFAVGTVARVANPLTARGWIEMYLAADGLLRPVGGQMIYSAYGTLLDITAAALSIGAWNEVWTSPVLPAWIVNCPTLSLTVEGSVADSASTANESHRMSIRTSTLTGGSVYDGISGVDGASAQAVGRGYSGVRARVTNRGNNLYGSGGGPGFASILNPPSALVGSVNSTTTRIRKDVRPGATTNTIKLFAVELWAGG